MPIRKKPYNTYVNGDLTIIEVKYKDQIFLFYTNAEFYERVKDINFKWANGYARATHDDSIRLHNLIIGKPVKPLVTDHINRNTYDNRKENLRIVTIKENANNRVQTYSLRRRNRKGNSVYKTKNGKWDVYFYSFGKHRRVGRFDTKEKALFAREQVNDDYEKEVERIMSDPNINNPWKTKILGIKK